MCHFITALIPASAELPAVKSVFEEYKRGFKQIQNPSILNQSTPGDIYVLTTRSICDCGTPLGSLSASRNSEDADSSNRLNKFRKQGWSEAKIERWMEQKQQTASKKAREQEVHAENATSQIEPWTAFLSAVLRSGYTPRISLLLHWYKARVETERFTILPHEKVSLQDLDAVHLLHISEDVIYNYSL